jgi:hypothetical protein
VFERHRPVLWEWGNHGGRPTQAPAGNAVRHAFNQLLVAIPILVLSEVGEHLAHLVSAEAATLATGTRRSTAGSQNPHTSRPVLHAPGTAEVR